MEGFVNVTQDGAVKKKVLVQGSGKQPTPGSKVTVHYIGKFQNGEVFDQSVGRGPFEFHVGAGEVIKGWDVGVAGMKTGEKSEFYIRSDYAYGKRGAGGVIPGNTDLYFTVELLKC